MTAAQSGFTHYHYQQKINAIHHLTREEPAANSTCQLGEKQIHPGWPVANHSMHHPKKEKNYQHLPFLVVLNSCCSGLTLYHPLKFNITCQIYLLPKTGKCFEFCFNNLKLLLSFVWCNLVSITALHCTKVSLATRRLDCNEPRWPRWPESAIREAEMSAFLKMKWIWILKYWIFICNYIYIYTHFLFWRSHIFFYPAGCVNRSVQCRKWTGSWNRCLYICTLLEWTKP